MSSVYTPTAAALTTVTLPSDGDTRNAASVNTPLQTLADALKYGYARTDVLADLTALAAITTPTDGLVRHVLGFGMYVFKTSATTGLSPFRVAATDATAGGWVSSTAHQTSVTRMGHPANCGGIWMLDQLVAAAAVTSGTAANWFPVTAGAATAINGINGGLGAVVVNLPVNAAADTARALRFPINDFLIDGATLTSVTMRLVGASAHAGLPTMMPAFGIQRFDADSVGTHMKSTAGSIHHGVGLAADASATLAAFKLAHDIVFTPDQNNVIDKSLYSYSLIFWQEGNTNAVVGNQINSFAFAQTMTDARRS